MTDETNVVVTIAMEEANPLMMLSAYFITRAVNRPRAAYCTHHRLKRGKEKYRMWKRGIFVAG